MPAECDVPAIYLLQKGFQYHGSLFRSLGHNSQFHDIFQEERIKKMETGKFVRTVALWSYLARVYGG
jgi:hypothetical protein